MRWTLAGATTEYTVTAAPEWLELHSWGPAGVSRGPSPLAFSGKVQYLTPGDVAPVEYATDGLRPFHGADLRVGGAFRWAYADASQTDDTLTVTFADALTGLVGEQCYRFAGGTDVIERWVRLRHDGTAPVSISALGSAGFSVPTPSGARLHYLCGQWAQEFTTASLVLPRGRFAIGSAQGVTGHAFSPYLAVQNAGDHGPTWGVQLAWTGSWALTAEADAAGLTRVRAGRRLDGPLRLAPGETLTTPVAAGAYSGDGVDGLARAWHTYERARARPGPRTVVYNSWEATTFDVTAEGQLALADVAADLGVETFVVDDGWFTGRADDTGGLGDWTPDPARFPAGFDAFVHAVRAKGLKFGLWVEPEMVNPASALYAEHPDWVYRADGRPQTAIRNQYLLDLGRPDVEKFVTATLDGLLSAYPIDYLKWDFNRPRTESVAPDADGAHVAALYRILDHLRAAFPQVTVEGCAAGGARVDLAMAARTDVLWPSDNTAPLDRLRVQHGFLAAHAPHLMSSWVTDAPGLFDARPRSLDFRFVLACAGVLGIGADVSAWPDSSRATAREWVARYKRVRDVITEGTVHRIGSPDADRCAVQYTLGDRTVVLAWNTGRLDGLGAVPGRDVRLPLRGLSATATYRAGDTEYSGAHLMAAGLPVRWTASHDATMVVLSEERA
ncbi:alpha-galactosidase [Cryptosporangium phraense]|uniref:alpha-galactosidase n=1 Tax=Cryptosporangium phraense TaxID=2593070 RepID=A0A545ATS3_9ACTN|nr:alpha-galactosidase [Cryptosporangium phraense]TQS44737.1 alpha-galactosidase [Cryptosporangium phraense]